jgi:hypothetical protein
VYMWLHPDTQASQTRESRRRNLVSTTQHTARGVVLIPKPA